MGSPSSSVEVILKAIPLKNETFPKKKEKVIVTGCGGFIGSHMVDYLIERGYDVYGLDSFEIGKFKNLNPKLKWFGVNLCDKRNTLNIFKRIRPHYVIHLAAFARIQPSLKEPDLWIINNVSSTINVLCASKQVRARKVIYSSSSSVYGDNKVPFIETMKPDIKTPYALSKLMGEQMCELFTKVYGLPCVIVRYFNVYGKRQIDSGKFSTVIGVFIKRKREGKKLRITNLGRNKRDFTYIDDIVRGTYLALKYGRNGEVYNLGCGTNYSLNYLATLIQPNKKMHTYGLVRKQEAWETKADIQKSIRELGWKPKVSLKEGIKKCIR